MTDNEAGCFLKKLIRHKANKRYQLSYQIKAKCWLFTGWLFAAFHSVPHPAQGFFPLKRSFSLPLLLVGGQAVDFHERLESIVNAPKPIR